MSGTTTLFGDGILDVHIANGVARITLGAATGQKDAKPLPSGMLVVPVMQLPVFARVLAEVAKQVEQRAKEAIAQAQAKAGAAAAEAPAESDQVTGAFRFNG
jgi:ABC-type phosphate transport system permease subunit